MTSPFTFLQFSDVHLDSPQNHGVISYGPSQRAERYADLVEAFVNALMLGKQQGVDAVFIAGGIWNHETIRTQTSGTVLEAIEELSPIPVYITPGESDPYTIDSPYSDAFLAARGVRAWPKNAFIFKTAEFSTLRHPTREDVTVTGFAYTARKKLSDRILAQRLLRENPGTLDFLLYHGTLDSYAGME
ncbi:MAG: metallophosphoesterase, partial [Candidatus Obscuribacterales bacterium]|nr:metallophosphoesterase [Candidatus Obscuribacterales bacterium]